MPIRVKYTRRVHVQIYHIASERRQLCPFCHKWRCIKTSEILGTSEADWILKLFCRMNFVYSDGSSGRGVRKNGHEVPGENRVVRSYCGENWVMWGQTHTGPMPHRFKQTSVHFMYITLCVKYASLGASDAASYSGDWASNGPLWSACVYTVQHLAAFCPHVEWFWIACSQTAGHTGFGRGDTV